MVNMVLNSMDKHGVRLTAEIEGSFGILHFAVLAFTTARPTTDPNPNVEQWPLLTQDLLKRGFRPARNADVEDIVLKAQAANGSMQCRASSEGLNSLLVDNDLVWSVRTSAASNCLMHTNKRRNAAACSVVAVHTGPSVVRWVLLAPGLR